MKKIIRISLALILLLIVGGWSLYESHPIVFKWMSGTARIIGKPVDAVVYTDGRLDTRIKVFHTNKYWKNNEKADYYLLQIPYASPASKLNIICLDKKINKTRTPGATSIKDYDFAFGRLFQSETGGMFSLFEDDMKGFNFETGLAFSGNEIKFRIPPGLGFDSIQVVIKRMPE